MDGTDDAQIPWPIQNQQVWSRDGSRDFAAWVSGAGDFFPLVEGYRSAAEVLVEHVAKGGHQDRLLYPIVFMVAAPPRTAPKGVRAPRAPASRDEQ